MRWLFSLIFIGATAANASLITLESPVKTYDRFRGAKISFSEHARVASKKGDVGLELTGTGVRVKKVLLFQANVYFAQSFAVPRADGVTKAWTPEELLSSPTRALRLSFVCDLSPEQIRDAFKESLAKSGVDPEGPLKRVLEFVAKEIKSGEELDIVTTRVGENQVLELELQGKTVRVDAPGVGDAFWRIWFGVPADSGLAELQKRLLTGLSAQADHAVN